jgi:hypothetical protein
VSSSTCTTATTVLQCRLIGATCVGACAGGNTCESDGGGGCVCSGPPVPCPSGVGAQACGGGTCPDGQSCQPITAQCNLQIGCGCRP